MGPSSSCAGDDAATLAGEDDLKRARAALNRFLYPAVDDEEFVPSAQESQDINLALKAFKPPPDRYLHPNGAGDLTGRRFTRDDFAPACPYPSWTYDPVARVLKLRQLLEHGKVPADQRANVQAAIEFIKSGKYRTHNFGPVVVFQDGEIMKFPQAGRPWWGEVSIILVLSFPSHSLVCCCG